MLVLGYPKTSFKVTSMIIEIIGLNVGGIIAYLIGVILLKSL